MCQKHKVYVVMRAETKDIVLVTTNKEKALSYLDGSGFSVSGHVLVEEHEK